MNEVIIESDEYADKANLYDWNACFSSIMSADGIN